MKHIKLFESFKLNELISKDSLGGKGALKDPGMLELFDFINSLVIDSPIAFSLDSSYGGGFKLAGPFGLNLYFSIWKQLKPGSYDNYLNVGYVATIGKFEIKAKTTKELIKDLKKSMEFKHFIKGSKVEKLAEARMKAILKRPYSDDNLIDYLYYSEPEVKAIERDNSGPWATSGRSVTGYTFQLLPAVLAWPEQFGKDKDETDEKYNNRSSILNDTLDKIKKDFSKKRGFEGGGISSNTVTGYSVFNHFQNPRLSVTVKNVTYYN